MIEAPGWYGKLPGMGDFAHRRIPETLRAAWDRWLQNGLSRLRVRHADWTARYLEAPIWCFVLGNDVIGAKCWIGVVMPSVDGVGRYFPFTVVSELVAPPTELQGHALTYVRQWWAWAMQAALDGLNHDLDANSFESRLHELFSGDEALQDDFEAPPLALPDPGQSLWFTDPTGKGGLGMASSGLPQDEQFEVLFGFGGDVPSGPGKEPS